MKLILHAIRVNPNGIEEIQMDDVSSFSGDDSNLKIVFNDGKHEIIPLRANDGQEIHEWSGFSLFSTRVGLKVDMNK